MDEREGRVMDLVRFLRERISEDATRSDAPHRKLETEFKARLVSHYELIAVRSRGLEQAVDQALWTLSCLAEVYADHPDFDESWRP